MLHLSIRISSLAYPLLFLLLLPLLLLCLIPGSSLAYVTRIDQCEPIQIRRCQSMPYNLTRMPNLLHHSTQENAALVFEEFEKLLDQHCSDALLFLLCSLHVPICGVSLQTHAIPPCRGVCERARAGCEPLMNAYNVSWPASLNCERLPRYERAVCVSPEAFVKPAGGKKKKCRCSRRRPSWQVFRKYRFDYALHVVVNRRKRLSSREVVYRVGVAQSLFSGSIKVEPGQEIKLWVNSNCACPKLRKGREYLVMGHEDRESNRLSLTHLSVVAKWKQSWLHRIGRWRGRLERTSRREKRLQYGKRGRRGRGRATPKHSWLTSLLEGHMHGGRFYSKSLPRHYYRRREDV